MPVATHDLIGREAELEQLAELLAAPDRLPAVVVLHGEAGIGKTLLWLAVVETAASRGYAVFDCRPSEVETRLSYAGLADLLGGVVDDILPELPPIQRRALAAALLLGDAEAQVDEHAVAAAFLASLRILAANGRLTLAVDDVQWLDGASLAALRFALARLDDEPIAVVLAARGDSPEWLRRTVPETRLASIEVGGLSMGALHELLRKRLGATFSRPLLIRLWETSAGNPLFALELAAALMRRGVAPAHGDPLPIPSALAELLNERLRGTSAAALEVASVVAASGDPTVDLLEAVIGADADTGLVEAVEAQILELDGDRLRFTHPLLATAVVARQTPSKRRSLHALLARVAATSEERARHLALASSAPSHKIASALEEAAQSARDRGAPTTAAELAQQALRLTPATRQEDARRRLILAVDMQYRAGDIDQARAALVQARATAAAGLDRATILVRLADLHDDPRETLPLYQQALAEAEGNDALEATIQIRLAGSMAWAEGAQRGIEHAELAVAAASRTDDVGIRAKALATRGEWQFRAGHGIQLASMAEAVRLERSLDSWPLDSGPIDLLCRQFVWAFELDAARPLLNELSVAHRTRDDVDGQATATWWRALLEWRAGNWQVAERHADNALEIRIQLGHVMPPDEFPGSIVAAHRGRVDDARSRAHRELAGGESTGIRIAISGSSWVLGFVELSLGDAAAALTHLRRSYAIRNDFMLEPAQRIELGDLLEALVAVGELEEADQILTEWEPRAHAVDRAWALAILARCRGLWLAAQGDFDGAFTSFERALGEDARATDPFHQARSLLALGRTQRRAKKRAAARATLEDALAGFEALGAPLWAEQTRAELTRIGGRAPSRGELTEAESRIAALVADGHTNREVAAALFLTEHSVETALTRVYRKLGVRSRGELARLRAAAET